MNARVDPTAVNQLFSKAGKMNANGGILFSSMGVAGTNVRDGWGQIKTLFIQAKYITIVIDLDDLRSLKSGNNPLTIIERRQTEVYISA